MVNVCNYRIYSIDIIYQILDISLLDISLLQGPVLDSEEEPPPTPSQSYKKAGDTGPWPGYPFNPAQWRLELRKLTRFSVICYFTSVFHFIDL